MSQRYASAVQRSERIPDMSPRVEPLHGTISCAGNALDEFDLPHDGLECPRVAVQYVRYPSGGRCGIQRVGQFNHGCFRRCTFGIDQCLAYLIMQPVDLHLASGIGCGSPGSTRQQQGEQRCEVGLFARAVIARYQHGAVAIAARGEWSEQRVRRSPDPAGKLRQCRRFIKRVP